MAAHPEMLVRTASILVADITLTHITCQNQDFFGRVEGPSLTPSHDYPHRERGGSHEKSLQARAQPGAMSVELARSVAAIAAAAAAAVATTTTASATTTLTILSLVYLEGTAVEVGAVQRLRGAGGIRI